MGNLDEGSTSDDLRSRIYQELRRSIRGYGFRLESWEGFGDRAGEG